MKEQIIKLQREIWDKQKKLDKTLQEYAISICPFNIGDDITIKGWTHSGKTGKVSNITGKIIDFGKSEIIWNATGSVYKKDGTISERQRFDMNQYMYEGTY